MPYLRSDVQWGGKGYRKPRKDTEAMEVGMTQREKKEQARADAEYNYEHDDCISFDERPRVVISPVNDHTCWVAAWIRIEIADGKNDV